MSSTHRTRLTAVAITTASVLALAACSSSSKKATSPTTQPSSAGASTEASAPASATGPAASGSPVLIGSFSSLTNPAYSTPQAKAGIEAAIASINAAGGVQGRPLQLAYCDTAYDTNKELSCTREVLGKKVVALVDPSVLADQSGAEFKLAQTAGVPVVGTQGLGPIELNTPVVFPLSSGIPGWVYGATADLLKNGATKIGIMVTADPASEFFASLVTAALKSAGKTSVGTFIADPKADPTLATVASKAISSGADGLVLAPAPLQIPKILTALKQASYSGKISSITALFAPALIKASGDAANGVLLTSQLDFVSDTTNPGITAFLASMNASDPSAVVDESTLQAWSATELLAKVAAGAKSLDAPGILAAFNSLSTPVDIGTIAPFSIVGKTAPLPMFARVLNTEVQFGTVDAGELKPSGDGFVDPFQLLASLK